MAKIHRKLIVGSAITLVLAICAQFPLAAQNANAAKTGKIPVSVPFVGCKSDGQVGPQDAPAGKNKALAIPADTAEKLAYYKAEDGAGVLAPRGWYCFGTYGSNGSVLYIGPTPLNSADLFSTTWKGIAGPAIQISSSIGDTSGRFEVAQIIARIFPAYKKFVQDVIAENIEPASSFHYGPYPKDKLIYRSQKIVEYETPADTDGLGTDSTLQKNSDPIYGVAILVAEVPDLLLLHVRLSPKQKDLAPIIIRQVELDAEDTAHSN